MKHVLFTFVCLSFAFTFSCSKKDNEVSLSGLRADINGKSWIANNPTATLNDNMLVIQGAAADGSSLSLVIQDAIEGKTYILDKNSEDKAFYIINGDQFDNYSTESLAGGEISITKLDKTVQLVSGFLIYAYNSQPEQVELQNGVFENVALVEVMNDPYPGKDIVTIKVDGVTWEPQRIEVFTFNNEIRITAMPNNGMDIIPMIAIDLPLDITTGVYELTSFGDYRINYWIDQITPIGPDEGKGKITILEHTDKSHLRAHFEFEGTHPEEEIVYSFTEGLIDIVY